LLNENKVIYTLSPYRCTLMCMYSNYKKGLTMSQIKAKRLKYQIEIEANIEGNNQSFQEVAVAIKNGALESIIDVQNVSGVTSNITSVSEFVEKEIDIYAEETIPATY